MAAPTTISVDIVASFGAFKEQLDQAAAATNAFANEMRSGFGGLTAVPARGCR